MKQIAIALFIPLFCLMGLFCSFEKPTEIDGTMSLTFVVVDTSRTLSSRNITSVPNAQIWITVVDYNIFIHDETDSNGFFELKNILGSHYQISAYKYLANHGILYPGAEPIDLMLTGSIEKDLQNSQTDQLLDSVKIGRMATASIVINEIYYSCPPNSGFYISDQFVELYNASSEIQYLDQLFICRISDNKNYDNNIVALEYYQFPGSGKEFPVLPNQLVVIAQDAIDHVNEGGAKVSIDLSQADWEFYNKYVPDIDNPLVPNLENMSPAKVGNDFMIHLSSDEVCLIRSSDHNPIRYYEQNGKPTSYRIFEVSQVLDGVEYDPELDHEKAFDIRIDAGLAGYGIERYSGKSIERHHPATGAPGFDTNNSTFDFVSLSHPTPGWQHTEADIFHPVNKLSFKLLFN